MTARHAATATPRDRRAHGGRPRLVGAIIALIVAGMLAAFWWWPADTMPLPAEHAECTVTGGGTLRLHTSDCGTLIIRGRVKLMAGQRINVTRTGVIAWKITVAK